MADDSNSDSYSLASTIDAPPSVTSVDHKLRDLKKQRSYRRGQVTKVITRCRVLAKKHASTHARVTLEKLRTDAETAIDAHDNVQNELDAVSDNPDAVTDPDERMKYVMLHDELTSNVEKLIACADFHHKAEWFSEVVRGVMSTGAVKSVSQLKMDELESARMELCKGAMMLREDTEVQEINSRTAELLNNLRSAVAAAAPAIPDTPSSLTSAKPDRPKMAPIHLDIPKFHGDPLAWEAFELSLNSILRHRAEGFSEADKFAIVRQAIVPTAGKALVADQLKQGATTDKLMCELKEMYGRPQLVVPTLVKMIINPPRTDQSAASLRKLQEQVLDHYGSLRTLLKGELDRLVPHVLRNCLEGKLREDWDRLLFEKLPEPTMNDFKKFIHQRLLWADSPSVSSTLPPPQQSSSPTPTASHNKSKTQSTPAKCAACGEPHWLGRCQAFVAMSTDARNKLVREKRLCLNCFHPSHGVKQCNNRHNCRHCSQRHHTLLHKDTGTRLPATPTEATPTTVATVKTPTDAPLRHSDNFMCTVTADLHNEGLSIPARVLLDHGSTASFISEDLASLLKLKRHPQDKLYSGAGDGKLRSRHYVFAKLHSRSSPFVSEDIQLSVLPKPFSVPAPLSKTEVLDRAAKLNISLSDTSLDGKVDILLGGAHPWDFCGESISDKPYRFISTKFGYGAIGPLAATPSVLTIKEDDSTLAEDLQKLWALDSVPESSCLSTDDQLAVDNFNTTTKFIDGRIQVTLPFKHNPPTLGDSKRQALSRFFSNERSLQAKDRLSAFNSTLHEYLQLGHAHVVPASDVHTPSHLHYYMPVHGIFKDSSTTTKIRPVFDASARTTTGVSLNQCLLVGPNLYPHLSDVLIRFRCHAIGLSADISKMFREVLLAPEHRDFHRFLMRDDKGKIQDCRMERVTFGVASSPFLATQALRYLADKFEADFPRAALLLRTTFYVDDFVSGANSIDDAIAIREELCGFLAKAGMLLRKWRSNSPHFLEATPTELLEVEPDPLTFQDSPKALGAHWNTTTDTLQVAVPKPPTSDSTVTKRIVASVSAAVFDVMGLFSPSTIIPRMLLQETWKLHLPWDKQLPPHLTQTWNSWISDLSHIGNFKFDRKFFIDPGPHPFRSLHGFSDASEKAYGATVYLRILDKEGHAHTALVTAKARVMPTKPMTIPRAELAGAHLLTKLLEHIAELLQVKPQDVHAWTDSSIVLHWLAKEHSQHKDRFVANRVQDCHQRLPLTRWKHVPSGDNPADLASRGVSASVLVGSTLWWKGPGWLSESPDGWPFLRLTRPPEAVHILAITPDLNLPDSQSQFLNTLWTQFSSLNVLERVVARIFRFAHNCRSSPSHFSSDTLAAEEIKFSHVRLLSLAQQQSLPEVYKAIKNDTLLPSNHSLYKFIVKKEDELIKVHSRVRNSHTPTTPKTLTPLHPNSKFTRLLCHTAHYSLGHPGVSALHATLLSRFYIPGLRNILKKISRACSSCQRAYAQPLSAQMGLLPLQRTTPHPPFTHTGVDFAGPFLIRQGHVRKPVPVKAYAALFICLTTKAVHFELCASLSSEDFRATLQRFVSRRGSPQHIYSDNGSNFLGAREEMRDLQELLASSEKTVSNFCQAKQIHWHHIPARSPHFGGLWEAGVRQMKLLLKKNLFPHLLRFDELTTILCEAEATLNSRPLTPITEDNSTTGQVLTPGHFLLGRSLLATPLLEVSEAKVSSLRRWRLVAKLQQDLWTQWINQYLNTLHQRTKWLKESKPVKVGDLVYIKDETLKTPTRLWPMARITQVFPGDDGQIRAAKVKCGNREYTRATNMLIPVLPMEVYERSEE